MICAFIMTYFVACLPLGTSTPRISRDDNDRVKRVIGPHMEESHSAKPWVVFLMHDRNLCGGFLLDPRTLNLSNIDFPLPPENSSDIVVTAAHCVLKKEINVTLYRAVLPNSITVAFGMHNVYDKFHKEMKFVGQSINIIAHEEYEYRFRSSKDIALIRLNASVPFGPNIHPLPISTHSTADVEDCMLTGYGPDPNKEVEEGSGTLTTANLTNEADVNGTMQTLAVTFNDSRSTEGDSGSPIVCRVNGTMFAHGVHSIGYFFSRHVEYANLFLLSPWLKSSLSELYSEAFFHEKLHRYLRYGLQNWNMPMNELEYIIQRYMGCLPKGLKMRLEDEKISNYGKIWMNNSLAEYVLVEDDAFNPHDLIGYTVEKNVYHCATACFAKNSHGSCSYLVAEKYCFFSAKRLSCEGTSCIQFGNAESVHIYFNGSFLGREPPVAKGAKPMQYCTMQETNKAMAIPGITELIYLSYKHRTWQVCPATLVSSNGLVLDLALVNYYCLHKLIHPYMKEFLPSDSMPDINVYFAPLPAKRIVVTFSNRPAIDNAIFLDLEEPVALPAPDSFVYQESNIHYYSPFMLNLNPFMGGFESHPFSKPWMVLLEDKKSQETCHGVFISERPLQLGYSSEIAVAVLTTAKCAEKMKVTKSIARFGVHLSAMESFHEQKAVVERIEVHSSVNAINEESENAMALIFLHGSIRINKVVHPIPLNQFRGNQSNGSRVSAFGWNIKCHHAKVLQEIPMAVIEDILLPTSIIIAQPVYNFDQVCNSLHHAGRPLMQCNNENRECLLLGLSSDITRGPNGRIVEFFLKPGEYLQWIEDTMKEAHIH